MTTKRDKLKARFDALLVAAGATEQDAAALRADFAGLLGEVGGLALEPFEIDLSSCGSSVPSTMPTNAARCPPADPPADAIRSGSIPNLSARLRTQRKADLASRAHTIGGSSEALSSSRYSTCTATMPREAKYLLCSLNCPGCPPTQPPP